MTRGDKPVSYSISTLLLRNLSDVFGENDPVRRRAAIDEIFQIRTPICYGLFFKHCQALNHVFTARLQYEKKDGQSRHNLFTTAVWENEELLKTRSRPWPSNFTNKASTPKKRDKSCRSKVYGQLMKGLPIKH